MHRGTGNMRRKVLDGKRSVGRHMHRFEDNIKRNLREIIFVGVD